ncbi:MAG TPA: cysteine desulfurase family protein [Candidatus Paceibacterota bacterium]
MKDKIYLDYAATTPMDARVLRVMRPYFSEKFGNPGSLHSFGQEAMGAIDRSRETVAKIQGVGFRDVIFTGSATEANNLVLRGVVRAVKNIRTPRVIVSAIEHESVLKTAQDLEEEGLIELKILPVDEDGIARLSTLKKLLNENTVLVSVMYANNETGAVQPVLEIGRIVADFRGAGKYPLFHTDAVQAVQYLDCGPGKLGADFMTISGHKIYGPKGIGALVARAINPKHQTLNSKWLDHAHHPELAEGQSQNLKSQNFEHSNLGLVSGFPAVRPLVTGGGQEFGLRSGTENVANIVGFAEAARLAETIKPEESKRITELRNYFWNKIVLIDRKIKLNGPAIADGTEGPRLPNNLNIYLPKVLAEEALAYLDMRGIAVSAGSACAARSSEPSHVLRAMHLDEKTIRHSLRVTLGRDTDKKQIDTSLAVIRKLIRSTC